MENQTAIHLSVEGEVEVVESSLRITKLGLLPAAFEQSVTAPPQFVRHQTGQEVDRCHRLRLGLLQPRLEHGRDTAKTQLPQRTIQLDEIHSGCSLILRLMKSRYTVSSRIRGSICRKNSCGCGRRSR